MKLNKNDKLTEKAFFNLILTSVLGILICMTCLVSTTWAWFSDDITSSENTIKAANFDLSFSVSQNDTKIEPTDTDENTYSLLEGTYSVTVQQTTADSTTGYCIITTSNGGGYYLNVTSPSPITFDFNIPTESSTEITVTFTPHWGKYSASGTYTQITPNTTVDLTANIAQ